jgi:hypothetical protein
VISDPDMTVRAGRAGLLRCRQVEEATHLQVVGKNISPVHATHFPPILQPAHKTSHAALLCWLVTPAVEIPQTSGWVSVFSEASQNRRCQDLESPLASLTHLRDQTRPRTPRTPRRTHLQQLQRSTTPSPEPLRMIHSIDE